MNINYDIFNEILEYIENTEETIDGEWGSARTRKELIEQGDMPDIYYKIKNYESNKKAT